MNEHTINHILTEYDNLKHYLNQFFQRKIYDDSLLRDFYKEVKHFLPELTNESPDSLQNYYAFMKISSSKIEDSILYSDKELFNKTLTQIRQETLYILEEF